MGCGNHPSSSDLDQMERSIQQQSNEVNREAAYQAKGVLQAASNEVSVQRFAEQRAKEVTAFAQLLQLGQLSGEPLSKSEIRAIETKIQQFAEEKVKEVQQYEKLQATDKELSEIEKNPVEIEDFTRPFELHHVYPQGAYAQDFFESKGVSVHEWVTPLDPETHHLISALWTTAWKGFIEEAGDEATPDEVLQFGQDLVRGFGLENA